jgi:hypothetical protein
MKALTILRMVFGAGKWLSARSLLEMADMGITPLLSVCSTLRLKTKFWASIQLPTPRHMTSRDWDPNLRRLNGPG